LWGAWLQLGLVFGLLGTVVGMVSAFDKLSESEAASPETLANDISFALITTAIGMIPVLIGLILMAVARLGKKYRAAWFFWFLIAYSVLWALNFPVGTILGGALIFYLISKKDEFLTANSEQAGGGNALPRAPHP